MIEVLLTIIPSICWLLFRFYSILRTPVEKLIEDLNIEIPHSPVLCIDSISETSIVIHWDIEIKFDENLYYVIIINDEEAATLTSTSCKLNNLSPHQLYRIEIVAINSITNFKSQSKPVFVQTCNKDELDENVNVDHLEDDVREVETGKELDDLSLESITIDSIKNIKDSKLLNDYVIKFQNELARTKNEYKQFQVSTVQEREALQRELCLCKQEFEEETDNKSKKDNDVKSLERSKDKLTFQKSKLTTQLNSLKNSLALFNTKFQENENKLKKLQERNNSALINEDQERSKVQEEITSVREKINHYKSEIEKTEENLKTLAIERKEMLSIINQLKPLVEAFNQSGIANTTPDTTMTSTTAQQSTAQPPSSSSTSSFVQSSNGAGNTSSSPLIFNKDGSLTKNAFDAIVKILQVMPSWQDEIMQEINQYQEFEQQWKEAFRNEIKKFVAIHQSLELARMNLDPNYQPVKMTEYQASIEFGGFSNALPKPKFNGKRNFSPVEDQSKATTNFYNHYSNVYSKEESDSDLGSPLSQQQLINQQHLHQQSHSPENYPPQAVTNDYGYAVQPDQLQQQQPQQPQQQQPYVSLEQINAAHNLDLDMNGANTPSSNPLISIDSTGQYQGFPYDDSIYTTGINSPLPMHNNLIPNYGDYNSLLYRYSSPSLSQSNLHEGGGGSGGGVWGTTNLSSNDLLNPSHHQNGFLMTPTQSSNIWSDDKTSNLLLNPNNHTRTISNNSQIWRNDINGSGTLRGFNTTSTPSNADFQPFSSNININNNNNGGGQNLYGGYNQSNLQPLNLTPQDEKNSVLGGNGNGVASNQQTDQSSLNGTENLYYDSTQQ
ncbi:hypothetical protein SBY92_004454 [Candida maltosa Xu316]